MIGAVGARSTLNSLSDWMFKKDGVERKPHFSGPCIKASLFHPVGWLSFNEHKVLVLIKGILWLRSGDGVDFLW